MKKLFLTLAVVALGSASSFAGTKTVPVKMSGKAVTPVDELFRGNEFDVSIYGAVGLGRVDNYRDGLTPSIKHYSHDAWGGGTEVNYFFTRYFGLGVEGDWLAGHDVVSSVSGNLIGRIPFEFVDWGIAPYGFLGGGGQFDGQNAGFGQIGAGVEARFKSHWGIFADGRWVVHDVFIDYALIRTGIRINF